MRTGIWIPEWIERLSLQGNDKLLFAEIVSLYNVNGSCYASNHYFSKILGLRADTITRIIGRLKKKGILSQTGFDGRKRFLKPFTNVVEKLPKIDPDPAQTEHPSLTLVISDPIQIREVVVAVSASDDQPVPLVCTKQLNKNYKLLIDKIKSFSKETREWLEVLIKTKGEYPDDIPKRVLPIW